LRCWLGGVVALLLLACGGADAPASPSGARNLVLVSLDTLRADRLGLYGYERDTSPHLDAWSREAFVFERAHSAANATIGAHHAIFQSRPASVTLRERGAPTLATLLRERGYRTAGLTDGGTMSRRMGFARGFEQFDDGNQGLAQSLPKALRFLDSVAGGDAPFYLFVHSFDVHLPYDPPAPHDTRFFPEYEGRVRGDTTLPLLRGVRRIFEQADLAEPVELDADERRKVNALYDGEIVKTDILLARLLDRIEAGDLRDDTLVVLLSDHGEEFWEHGSVLHSHTLFQELVHVPWIVRVPGWRGEARRIPERVSMLDVLPTLLELLEVPSPATARGRSLVPLLRGEGVDPAPILAEGFPYGRKQQSVIAGRFKLIRNLVTGGVALYDLDADPAEERNIAARHPGVRIELLELLGRELPKGARPEDDPLSRPEDLDPALQQRLRELGYID
jgi:arylsulfatase A-like enzyme